MQPNKYNESLPKPPTVRSHIIFTAKIFALFVSLSAISIGLLFALENASSQDKQSNQSAQTDQVDINSSTRWVLTTASNGATMRQEGSMTEDACKAVMNEFINLKLADTALCLDPETGSTHSQQVSKALTNKW